MTPPTASISSAICVAVRRSVPLKNRCSRKCEMPDCSMDSYREPFSTQMPMVTDERSASSSESTRMPFGSLVARMRLVRGLLARCVAERLLAGEPDLSRLVDLEHLHVDHVALTDDVGHLPHALVGELRDVDQAVGAGHDFHERAEVDDLADGAAVDLAD